MAARRKAAGKDRAAGPADGGVPLADLLGAVSPPDEVARAFTERGRWRTETVLHDLYRGAARHPHRAAVVAHRAHRPPATRVIRLSYGQLAAYTDRFAHALDALGVRQGDPVAFQLPNRWETCALLLACLRVGAVAVPVMAGYGAHDLHAVLTAAQPRLCVVPDVWEGTRPARTLADLAPSLPWLRHRVVLGDAADTGAVDFEQHFVRTPHERYRRTGWLPLPARLADRICCAITSIGLHGSHAMALHSPNSLYAGRDRDAHGAGFSALPLAALPSLLHTLVGPLTRGAAVVLQDVWDPRAALDLLAEAGVRHALATPAQWTELVAAQQQHPRELDELRHGVALGPEGASTRLVRQVHDALRVPLRGGPEGEAVPDGGAHRTPGAASPLAVWRRETRGLRLTWGQEHAEGPGDLAAPDEDGWPPSAQEVGGVFLVPVTEVQERLLTHPAVREATVVARTDPRHGELACAVVVPEGDPPTLLELRDHLTARGVRPAHLPARLELVAVLPGATTAAATPPG
ncbi:AMP-binding protein [Streptomyces beihaiensis]|uniref:AMP-binding protein n=1 Tax=Streptomyces beihaiensis TaxID=2984495 RepID=A0ABT3TWV9_9ACTN|nr:AMP-binding protein [Streptomyces beihaiensis]MCX3060867.1 AMP-binding protein [Streptomyces beihaiensis]